MESSEEITCNDSSINVVSNDNIHEEKTLTPPPQQDQPKKSKKDDRNKKDDKVVEQFMKSLNSVPSLEEKLSLVCKKYVQTVDDGKKMQFYIKQSDKRHALLLKEKEQLQHEYNKTILVKSKLENLCRELQKQNKAIKEESLLKIREEEERRKETQAKFQNTLSEITTLLQQNNEKNAKLRDDNISMSEKFKSVVQQYQLREQQVDKMAKQMALESQLSEAKLQKAGLEYQAEKERLIAEMEHLKVTVAQCRAKIMELQGTETALRGQLAVYTDKYDEFQNALVKSNQVFGGFKEQMENMSKKIKKLEKESLSWKNRWEKSQTALLDMCGERQASEERAVATGRQLHHMQSLCRTLQAERTVLLNTLKENNIERPPLPVVPPVPAPAPASTSAPTTSNNKVDAMAANCAQLRQSLAHLQTQLNVLTNKNSPKEEPAKVEKQKKSKSKKSKAEKLAQTTVKEDDVGIQGSSDSIIEANREIPSAVDDCEVVPVQECVTVPEDEESLQNDNNQFLEGLDNKVDDQTLENLIQAISNANISLCDLEVVSDEKTDLIGAEIDKVEAEISNEVTLVEESEAENKNETNDTNMIVEEVNVITCEKNDIHSITQETNVTTCENNDINSITQETNVRTCEKNDKNSITQETNVSTCEKNDINSITQEKNISTCEKNDINSITQETNAIACEKNDINSITQETNVADDASHIEIQTVTVDTA